mmetsp:Transcript_60122/g.179016  ORF Transcript_60122/g.179016 Transcript_60122/m.179016 type:complete len:468 (+) Transcript_60122:813-2216(+)
MSPEILSLCEELSVAAMVRWYWACFCLLVSSCSISVILFRAATTAPSASSIAAWVSSTDWVCSLSAASTLSHSSTFALQTVSTSCTFTSASWTSDTEAVASSSMARARPSRDSVLCFSFSRAEAEVPESRSRTEASFERAAYSPVVHPSPVAIASFCTRISASCCCCWRSLLFSSWPPCSWAEVWLICSDMAASRAVCSFAVASAPSSCMLPEAAAAVLLLPSADGELPPPTEVGEPTPAATCNCSSSSAASQRTREGPALASVGRKGRSEAIRAAFGCTFSRHQSAKAHALQTEAPSGGTSPISAAMRAGEEAQATRRVKPRSLRPTDPRKASAACTSSPPASLGLVARAALPMEEVGGRVTSRSSTRSESPMAAFASRSRSSANRSLAMRAARSSPAMMRPLLVLPPKKAENRVRASLLEVPDASRKALCVSSSQASQRALPMNSAKAACLLQRSWKATSEATPP